jgi:hypothetical protein
VGGCERRTHVLALLPSIFSFSYAYNYESVRERLHCKDACAGEQVDWDTVSVSILQVHPTEEHLRRLQEAAVCRLPKLAAAAPCGRT